MIRNATMKAKKFMYIKEFRGIPTLSNFQLVEEELPEIKNGEFLTQAQYLSVDPYMRSISMPKFQVPCQMIGGQIAD